MSWKLLDQHITMRDKGPNPIQLSIAYAVVPVGCLDRQLLGPSLGMKICVPLLWVCFVFYIGSGNLDRALRIQT